MDCRTEALAGLRAVARIVASTYGPNGSRVMIERAQGLLCTKDGYAVLQESVPWGDGAFAIGQKVLLDAVTAQNVRAGDGTTLLCILAGAMAGEAIRLLAGGHDHKELIASLDAGLAQALAQIDQATESVTEESLLRVAECTAHEPELASLIHEAVIEAGEGGHIWIASGYHTEDRLFCQEGAVIQCRPAKRGNVDEAMVAICREGLSTFAHIAEILEYTAGNQRPLCLFAPWLEGEAAAAVAQNPQLQVWFSALYGDPEDLEVVTGATSRSIWTGYAADKFKPEWFGGVSRAILKKDSVVLYPYADRIDLITDHQQTLLSRAECQDSPFDKQRLQERSSRMMGSMMEIRMRAASDAEARERRGRLEDAVLATQLCLQHGTIRGAANVLSTLTVSGILGTAISVPLRIIQRTGVAGEAQDSAMVVRLALQHSVSAIRSLFATSAMIQNHRPIGIP